jgi:hypothetical protein
MEGFGFAVVLLAFKSVWQHYTPTRDTLRLLGAVQKNGNESIRTGLANNVSFAEKVSWKDERVELQQSSAAAGV